MKQTLIVVYKEKDEVAVNLLRKLLEKKDDVEGEIVGVEDRSVELVAWTEKVWLDNKAKGTTKSKILFLGDVKVTPGVLYDFKIQHTYKKPITILATALGFVSIYLFFTREDTTRFLLLFLGINNLAAPNCFSTNCSKHCSHE